MITDLDREIHKRFSKANNFDDMEGFYNWITNEKYLSVTEVLESVKKVEKHKTILCVFWCATIVGIIATICYTLPYLWPKLYE